MGIGDAVQTAAVLVGLFAAMSALWIASRDRREGARRARLLFELDVATRLIEALVPRGGLTGRPWEREDDVQRGRIAALTAALGEARVPHLWHNTFKDRPTPPGSTWKVSMDDIFIRPGAARDEAITALEAIAAELRQSEQGRRRRRRQRR